MKRSKFLLLCALIVALVSSAGIAVTALADTTTPTAYYNADGTDFTWDLDANGISVKVPHTKTDGDPATYTPVAGYGAYSPENTYSKQEDGSVTLVLQGGYLLIGGEMDAKSRIDVTFTMNPQVAWGAGASFTFALFDSMDAALQGGNAATGAKLAATGSTLSTDANFNKIAVGSETSAAADYTVVTQDDATAGKTARLTFVIGKTAAESSVALNGVKFATPNIAQADFTGGNVYVSLCVASGEKHLESKIKISQPMTYYNENGEELDWAFDKNGVSTAVPYTKAGVKVSDYYGIYSPDDTYTTKDEGSVFVLTNGCFLRLGEAVDVTRAIDVTMHMDPNNAWGAGGFGRFMFALFDDIDLLMRAGNDAWNPATGSKATAFGYLNETDANFPEKFNHLEVGNILSEEVALIRNTVTLRFYIGETVGESFAAVNGKYFAPLAVKQSDFEGGKAYISMVSYDANLEAQIKISQADVRTTVHLTSENDAFTEQDVPTTIGFPFAEPDAPAITGFTFDAWYTDLAYVFPYDFTGSYIAGETTLYARYFDDAKEYVNVTLRSDIGDYDAITFKAEKGKPLPAVGKVFLSEGFGLTWKTADGAMLGDTALDGDVTLTAVWVEEEIVLYHKMHDVVDKTYLWEYLQDENGWDAEYTDYTTGDTFVDEDGNQIISPYYGSYQHDTSFKAYDQYTDFLLPAVGAITNLKRLDLTKEIVITFSVNNWDTANDNNPFAGSITFQLFDNLLSALKSGHEENPNAKAAILTSSVDADVNYGRFKDLINNVRSESVGYEQDKKFVLKLFISEDGTENYVTVNDTPIEGALAGLKRTDFKGGYAYLHIANHGSTHMYRCLVAQTSMLTKNTTEHGGYTADKEGQVLFKDRVTLTLTPDEGYAVKSVRVGEKEYFADANNIVTFFKAWEDEEITVTFAVAYTCTFNANGGNAVSSQTVCIGDKFFKPSNPKKEGYKFDGWYTDEALTSKYDFTTAASQNITLYAKWTANAEEAAPKKGCGCKSNVSGGGNLIIAGFVVLAGITLLSLRTKKHSR